MPSHRNPKTPPPSSSFPVPSWYPLRTGLATLGFALMGAIAAGMTTCHADVRDVFPWVPVGLPVADVLDLFPLALSVPCIYLMYRVRPDRPISDTSAAVFITCLAFWTLGTGLHNAANALDHIVRHLDPHLFCPVVNPATPPSLSLSSSSSSPSMIDRVSGHTHRPHQTHPCVVQDVHAVTYWYDEVLSHAIQHTALHVLALLAIRRQITLPFPAASITSAAITFIPVLAGILYGVETFMFTVEGQTVYLGLPYSIAVLSIAAIHQHHSPHRLSFLPVLSFYTVSAAVTLLLLAAWYSWHGGFPEFSELGLLA